MQAVLTSDRQAPLTQTYHSGLHHHRVSYRIQSLSFAPSFVFYARDRTRSFHRVRGDVLHALRGLARACAVRVSLGGDVDVPLFLPRLPFAPVRLPHLSVNLMP